MKQSQIMYPPRFPEQRRNQNDRSPFPSTRTSRITTTHHNLTPMNEQPLNRSILGTSRIDNIQNIQKNQTQNQTQGFKASYTNFSSLSEMGRLSHNNSMNSIHSNQNSQVQMSQIVNQKNQQYPDLTDILREVNSKIEKVVTKITQSNERLDNIQKRIFENNKQKQLLLEQSLITMKQKIINEINLTNNSVTTSSFINSVQIYVQALKDQIFDFNKELFQRKQSQIINNIKASNQNQDKQFQKNLQFKFNSQHKIFKENIDDQIKSLKKTLLSEIQVKVAGLSKIHQQTSINKSSYQYPFRPLILKYTSSLRIVDPVQNHNKSQSNHHSLKDGGEIDSEELIYYVDPDGYLLDKDCYYILDTKSARIRLPHKQIEMLCSRKTTHPTHQIR